MPPYYGAWYGPGTLPHQPQHPHHLQQHPHPPPGAPGQPHAGMPMSPRTQPPPLPRPSTPTQSHAVPNAMHLSSHQTTASQHTRTSSISGLTSPPPTPSTSSHGN